MQVTIYSENFPKGLVADWPVVPRVGDKVQVSVTHGVDTFNVLEVMWHAEKDGSFHSVDVHLEL